MNTQPYRKVLRAVADLHVRGYQRLRILPYFAGPGYWRCIIAPAMFVSGRHGAELATGESESDLNLAYYSATANNEYWGWKDTKHCTPAKLAEVFLDKHPKLAQLGYGQDWLYAGWYQYMLHQTYPDMLPITYADHNEICGFIALLNPDGLTDLRIALPPVGFAADLMGSKDRRK